MLYYYYTGWNKVKNRAFIFDLDGVLIDSKEVHYLSLNKALSDINEKYIISLEDQKGTFEGLSTNQKLRLLTDTRGLPEYLHDHIWKTKQANSIDFFNSIGQDYELINIFKEIKKNNIRIGVASNSIKKTLETCLISLGLYDLVDFYISNEDVKNPKPDSEMYDVCISELNSDPQNTTIFEDSYVGRTAAVLSGARLVSIDNRSDLNIEKIRLEISNNKKHINILIPMAGEGSRFKLAGYKKPKPLIDINNKSMIQTVVDNLNYSANYIFIVKEDDNAEYDIKSHIDSFCDNAIVISQNGRLDGATKSALLAKKIINTEVPLLIANSDQYIIWNSNKTINNFIRSGVDGGILTFKSNEKKWSFVKKNKNDFVSAVAEKNAISDEATCGIYYWKHGSDFVKYAEQMINKEIKTNNEYYICPVYNEAIQDEKIIVSEMVYEMWGLGTPEDLSKFLEFYK